MPSAHGSPATPLLNPLFITHYVTCCLTRCLTRYLTRWMRAGFRQPQACMPHTTRPLHHNRCKLIFAEIYRRGVSITAGVAGAFAELTYFHFGGTHSGGGNTSMSGFQTIAGVPINFTKKQTNKKRELRVTDLLILLAKQRKHAVL